MKKRPGLAHFFKKGKFSRFWQRYRPSQVIADSRHNVNQALQLNKV